jgi:hypothetical protein
MLDVTPRTSRRGNGRIAKEDSDDTSLKVELLQQPAAGRPSRKRRRAPAEVRSAVAETRRVFGVISDGGKVLDDTELRNRWGIRRTYTAGNSWAKAKAESGTRLENRDVAHTGCCKGYSLATLLRPELDGRNAYRRDLDKHVVAWRQVVADALTEAELELLRSDGATNRSDWRRASSLEEAKDRVRLSYDAAKKVGHSMSPVWLEEWEASIICHHESSSSTLNKKSPSSIVIVEIHDGCPSNASRSHFQLVLPSPQHVISLNDTVVVLKRMQCHYNPVWVDGKPRSTVGDLPVSFRRFFRLGC